MTVNMVYIFCLGLNDSYVAIIPIGVGGLLLHHRLCILMFVCLYKTDCINKHS